MNKYVIKNEFLEAAILPYGATLQSLLFAGVDVAVGYDTEEEYRQGGNYIGATVGRNANRIAGARFILNGREYALSQNQPDGGHHHGGFCGLDKKEWRVLEHRPDALRLGVSLADGEEGYPGGMEITVTYALEGAALNIIYEAVSDRDTVFNPTNHTYFNLEGIGSQSAMDHRLWINADCFTPVNATLDPIGEIRALDGSPLDFREERRIGDRIDGEDEQLKLAFGYDQNYCIKGEGFRHAATLYAPQSGIRMECHTDRPGMHLYTANFFADLQGKGGIALKDRMAVCLETQCYPAAIHHPAFPSPILKAGEPFYSITSYRFVK